MNRTLIILLAASLSLSACGGSGGSAPVASPDASLEITTANAMQVAQVAYEAALDNQQLSDAGGFVIGGSGGPVATNNGEQANLFKATSKVALVPIPTEIIACAISGSRTVNGDIADPFTPTLTAGDFVQVEHEDCDDGFDEVTNGIVRADIDAFSGDFLGELFNLTMTLTLTDLQVSTFENQSTTPTDMINSNGALTLSIDTTSFPFVSTSTSGNSLVIASNSSSESLTNFASMFTIDGNIAPAPYTSSSSGTLDSTQLDGVIRYSTPVTFAGLGADFPDSGEFLVEGSNSSLRLVADNNVDVRILVDLGADGTIDQTINTTWAELVAS